MLKRLQFLPRRWFSLKEPIEGETAPSKTEYLLFPTNYPVSPYYFYCTKINTHLADYIIKNNIKYVAAFPKRPAVYRRNFYPTSIPHLEEERKTTHMQLDSQGIAGLNVAARPTTP